MSRSSKMIVFKLVSGLSVPQELPWAKRNAVTLVRKWLPVCACFTHSVPILHKNHAILLKQSISEQQFLHWRESFHNAHFSIFLVQPFHWWSGPHLCPATVRGAVSGPGTVRLLSPPGDGTRSLGYTSLISRKFAFYRARTGWYRQALNDKVCF